MRLTADWCPDQIWLVRVGGELDADASRAFDHYLRARLPPRATHVVVDLGQVESLGARAVRTLVEHTRRLAPHGRVLLTVASNPYVRRVVGTEQAAASLNLYQRLPLALAACKAPAETLADQPLPASGATRDELAELRQEVLGLRAALRAQPAVARAVGVVQERYGLPDSGSAYGILRDSAERHDLRVYTLARSLLCTPMPQGDVWFPGRTRRPAPSLSFVQQHPDHKKNRGTVLSSLLEAASHYMRAPMAAVHLVDPPGETLRLEHSTAMPPALADHLAGVDAPGAAHAGAVIPDLMAGRELLDAGIRSSWSTPLLTADDHLLGLVTVYHSERTAKSPRPRAARLDHAATEVAAWLEWHRRTVVPDALEDVHERASGRNR
ncbi:hypothetical protein AOZ06_23555 [Kibdelosporangium phytohabitans]|uniref:STAS domain-containing protein n=2 Tax=Kibdelosporangium phytohabitans TaxID=860235 RepID=A0A0N9HW74_9PSEU|nr:STAS domain-containing protein [Kibdelosporangium phytohabitans]ALG09484.1 hypothetical protein AOZ06_23555 [Kibdelosporangium phytohabitans]